MSEASATTLTPIGITKQAVRLVESISHATYIHDEQEHTVPLFRAQIEGSIIRLYIYFDDSLEGEISSVKLVDKDGDVIIASGETYQKAPDKGFYVAFKYKIVEEAVSSVESL